ncbi:MAG: alpha/beta fold hydrolase, partial [Rhizobiaceae bacterium]
MLAWALRFILLVAALLMVMAWPRHLATSGAVGATLIVVVAFLAVLAAVLLLSYAIAQANAGERPAGVRALSFAGIAGEYAALVLFYVFIQPFERLWMGSDAVGRLKPGDVPVLLVHGYMCNRGYWWWFRARLRERGHAVATITLESPITGIEELADNLDRRIADLLEETGARQVALVTHSMGGLVARAMMRRHGDARVARFIT